MFSRQVVNSCVRVAICPDVWWRKKRSPSHRQWRWLGREELFSSGIQQNNRTYIESDFQVHPYEATVLSTFTQRVLTVGGGASHFVVLSILNRYD